MIDKISFLQKQSHDGYENINFSKIKSEKRINKAKEILGTKVVTWIIGFTLFLLGVTRKDVCQLINTPYETFNSFIKRIWNDGLGALEDRRFSYDMEPMTPELIIDMPTAKIQGDGDEVIVHLPYAPHETSGDIRPGMPIRIPYANKVMIKAVLLTLLQNRILDSQTVADILGYTRSHTLHLKRQIFAGSMEEVLFDSRQGQKQCYVFNSEVKAELIQQCLANAIVGKSTSSEVLASSLKERCGLDLSQRSIRYHVQKLGLKYIKKTLPQIIEQLKKNSGK